MNGPIAWSPLFQGWNTGSIPVGDASFPGTVIDRPLALGQHASTKGARAAHCASVIAISHLPLIQSGNGRTTIWFRG